MSLVTWAKPGDYATVPALFEKFERVMLFRRCGAQPPGGGL